MIEKKKVRKEKEIKWEKKEKEITLSRDKVVTDYNRNDIHPVARLLLGPKTDFQ